MATTPTLAELQAQIARQKTAALRTHFVERRVRGNGRQKPAADLTVNDWAALELLMLDPPDVEYNPGGPDFELILRDTQDAIAAQDAQRLLDNFLLIYKAVRRG